jgi:hypothetical protein
MGKLEIFLISLAVIALVSVLFVWERAYWNENFPKWAKQNGLSLISFRSKKILERPWFGSEDHIMFRVKVRNRAGVMQEGRVTFSCWYPFAGTPDLIDEEWE